MLLHEGVFRACTHPGVYVALLIPSSHLFTLIPRRDDCQAQTAGFPGNKHHKFATLEQAKQYLAENGVPTGSVTSAPAASSSTASTSRTLQHGSALRGRTHGTAPYARTQPAVAKTSKEPARSANSQWAALASEVIEDESGWDVVYSDGACKGNGKVGSIAGVGVWWGHNDARFVVSFARGCCLTCTQEYC